MTEQDILAGKVKNSATATGEDPEGDEPDDTPGTSEDPTDPVDPKLAITKTADPTKDVAVKDEVEYTVVVTNTGNVTVSSIALTDTLVTLDEEAFSLEPGASKTITYKYTVAQKDVDAGVINNTVTANGESPVEDKKVEPVSASAKVTTEDAKPGIDVEKSSTKGEEDVAAGEDLTYEVIVTNTGNVTLNEITLTDDHGTPAGYKTTLAPGESDTVTYTYTVTKADDDKGSVTNTVTGVGTPARGKEVSDTDSVTTTVGHNDIIPTPDPDEGEFDADSGSLTVMYDGEPHSIIGKATRPDSKIYYRIDKIDGNEVESEWTTTPPSRINVGVTEFSIKAENDKYQPVEKSGFKIEVTKRPLTITSASDQKVYDGKPLTNDNVTIDGLAPTDEGKLVVEVTGSQTYVGSSPNYFQYRWEDETTWTQGAVETVKSYFVVYAANGDDSVSLADNYDIKTVKGTLTVTDDVDDEQVIQKTHEDKKFKVGDTITFTIKVTNIYDEPKTITIDEQNGVTITGTSVFEDVQPGETVTTTATHKVTEADAKSGKFKNTATASFSGEDKTFKGEDTVKKIQKPKSGNGPNTGDNGYGFDLTMMLGSAAAFLAMLTGTRRKREQE